MVTYKDKDGNEKTVACDSVVISGGMRPRQDEALKFYGTADRVVMIGDCRDPGNIQKAMRSAFAAASLI